MQIIPVILACSILQHIPIRQLREAAIRFLKVRSGAMQVCNIALRETHGVLGVAGDGGDFGLEAREIVLGYADHTVRFVFYVVDEEEVVLLGRRGSDG